MLVLSRKISEAILIDSSIRIEVVNMAKATVRVRLMAPRSLQLPHGPAKKDARDRPDSPARPNPVGMDVFHMTLVNQQVVPLGESVSLGVVDADKTRVLFFVDAPAGTSVAAIDHQKPDRASEPSNQILLQFMGQTTERPDEQGGRPSSSDEPAESPIGGDGSAPDVLPFPGPSGPPEKHRP